MTQLQQMATEAALAKMVSSSHFDICTIDSICKMMNLVPDRETYALLRTLHCVNYDQMRPELLAALPDLIAKVLQSPSFDASRMNIVPTGNGLRVISN
jgi:hypothetical protein